MNVAVSAVCMAAVAAVKIDLLNCPNWVSCFSNGILSCYMRYLSVMQRPVILHFCVILMVSIAVES